MAIGGVILDGSVLAEKGGKPEGGCYIDKPQKSKHKAEGTSGRNEGPDLGQG